MNCSRNVIFLMVGLMALAMGTVAQAGEKPSIDLDWYGYVKANAAYDQNLTSHGDFVMWVNPQTAADDDAQFNMTHRASRMGFNASSKDLDAVQITGKFEVDLFGNAGTDNKATLLLRHAYFTVSGGSWTILAGQSWDLISPLNPSTLNYSVLWGAGNIQYRRPQISAFYRFETSPNSEVEIAAGAFRTIGNDLTPTFTLAVGEAADGSDDGSDAAIPSVQGRLDYKADFNGTKVRVGASGLYGKLKAETNLGNSEEYESYVASGHLQITFSQGFGLSGEGFIGSNLGSYFGGILNSNRIDGLEAQGGWGSAWFKLHKNVKVTGGYAFDDPLDDDLLLGQRSRNQAIFGNIQVTPVSFITAGVEVSQWETEYLGVTDPVQNLRVETALKMNF